MTSYRVYFLDGNHLIDGPPRELECADDAAAIIAAQVMATAQDMELWQGERRVKLIARSALPT